MYLHIALIVVLAFLGGIAAAMLITTVTLFFLAAAWKVVVGLFWITFLAVAGLCAWVLWRVGAP